MKGIERVKMGILIAFAGVTVAGDEPLIFVGEAFVGVVDFVEFDDALVDLLGNNIK